MRALLSIGLFTMALWGVAGCKHTSQSGVSAASSSNAGGTYRINPDQPKLCAAVRGNGPGIWAHFGSMSKILETEGLIEGMAGGSSASITSFLYESMLANPELWNNCEGGCTSQQVADRAAFLMKTLPFWLEVAKNSKEGVALAHILELKKILASFDLQSFDATDRESTVKALEGLRTLLTSSNVKNMLNQEFLDFINPKNADSLGVLRFRALEAKKELMTFGNFGYDTNTIFFRPGIIDFKAVSKIFGHIGDFYAGSDAETNKKWPDLLNSCTSYARNRTPWEIAPSACGQKFSAAILDFVNRAGTSTSKRHLDSIGRYIPTIISTATLVGEKDKLTAARNQYWQGQTVNFAFDPKALVFGYSSDPRTLAKLSQNMPGFTDYRSSLYRPLGTMQWGTMIALSPAEPGLASVLPFKDESGTELSSFGGWSDLSPVMVLKASSCEKVVYVTREGEDSAFSQGVAGLLGLKEKLPELYSLKNKKSSYSEALNQADSVYCTKWNDYNGTSFDDVQKLFNQAYKETTLFKGERVGAPLGCGLVR